MLTTVLHSEGEKLQSRVCFALFRKTIARFVPAEPLDSEILPNIIAKMIKKKNWQIYLCEIYYFVHV